MSAERVIDQITNFLGSYTAILLSVGIVVLWLMSGPFFNFSEVWQLIINTSTTVITFLMIFVLQKTQNRDTKAMQLKLSAIIKFLDVPDEFVDVEKEPETQVETKRKDLL